MSDASEAIALAPAGAAEAPTQSQALRLEKVATEQYSLIWRFLRRIGVAQGAADDAAQQVFVVLSQKIGRVEPGLERAFLFQTALRVAMAIRRGYAQRREALGDDALDEMRDPGPLPDANTEEVQHRAYLDRILDALPQDLRVVFVLYELEELPLPGIATLLGIPLGTATSRLRRARETFSSEASRLRARLERRTR
jgi:RNA polymerase sigma-70 factor, ECF subfamily